MSFELYRYRLFHAIRAALERDGHHKHYEGEIECGWRFGSYFEEDKEEYFLNLNCYVLGPRRSYSYVGKDEQDVLRQANADLDKWLTDYKGSE